MLRSFGAPTFLRLCCKSKTSASFDLVKARRYGLNRSATTVAPLESPHSSSTEQDPALDNPNVGANSHRSFSYYWETSAPSAEQLQTAVRFFTRSTPSLLYSTSNFRTVQISALPEVAFLGRSNVGKSSLLNQLLGCNICRTSKKAGRTITMNFFAAGGEDGRGNPGKLVVLDLPGYGKKSRKEWGREIIKYLIGRRQLKRAFLLIDATHGIKQTDLKLLRLMREYAISHQVIFSKADKILLRKLTGDKTLPEDRLNHNIKLMDNLAREWRKIIQPPGSQDPVALGELIVCSTQRPSPGKRLGINDLRWAVLNAVGLEGVQMKKPAVLSTAGKGKSTKSSEQEENVSVA